MRLFVTSLSLIGDVCGSQQHLDADEIADASRDPDTNHPMIMSLLLLSGAATALTPGKPLSNAGFSRRSIFAGAASTCIAALPKTAIAATGPAVPAMDAPVLQSLAVEHIGSQLAALSLKEYLQEIEAEGGATPDADMDRAQRQAQQAEEAAARIAQAEAEREARRLKIKAAEEERQARIEASRAEADKRDADRKAKAERARADAEARAFEAKVLREAKALEAAAKRKEAAEAEAKKKEAAKAPTMFAFPPTTFAPSSAAPPAPPAPHRRHPAGGGDEPEPIAYDPMPPPAAAVPPSPPVMDVDALPAIPAFPPLFGFGGANAPKPSPPPSAAPPAAPQGSSSEKLLGFSQDAFLAKPRTEQGGAPAPPPELLDVDALPGFGGFGALFASPPKPPPPAPMAQPPLPATPPFQMAPPPPAPMAKGADKQSEIQQAIDEARIDREKLMDEGYFEAANRAQKEAIGSFFGFKPPPATPAPPLSPSPPRPPPRPPRPRPSRRRRRPCPPRHSPCPPQERAKRRNRAACRPTPRPLKPSRVG